MGARVHHDAGRPRGRTEPKLARIATFVADTLIATKMNCQKLEQVETPHESIVGGAKNIRRQTSLDRHINGVNIQHAAWNNKPTQHSASTGQTGKLNASPSTHRSIALCLSARRKRHPVPLMATLQAALVSLASAGTFTWVHCFDDHLRPEPFLLSSHISDAGLGPEQSTSGLPLARYCPLFVARGPVRREFPLSLLNSA